MAIMRMLTMEGPGPFVGLGGSQDAGLLAGTGGPRGRRDVRGRALADAVADKVTDPQIAP